MAHKFLLVLPAVLILTAAYLIFQIVSTGTPLSFSHFRQNFAYKLPGAKLELLTDEYIQTSLSQSGEFTTPVQSSVFDNLRVEAPNFDLARQGQLPPVLSAATGQNRWIEVDLSDQKLYAWEDGKKVFEFVISSGRSWTPTIEGEYRIWIKMRNARMRGGSQARGDYYDLTNVPYVMYYYRGYGLHGTYWHNNFGSPMSHGCVNLKIGEAEQLFNWVGPVMSAGRSVVYAADTNPGTRVVVHQ